MKYLTEKKVQKALVEGKKIDLTAYVPTNTTEQLYYLQPPPEPTHEGEVKQLIIKMFFGIERGKMYHFDVHQCLKIHEVTAETQKEILRLLRNTLAYLPRERVSVHYSDLKERIETYTPEEDKEWETLYNGLINRCIKDVSLSKFSEVMKYKSLHGKNKILWFSDKAEAIYFARQRGFTIDQLKQCFESSKGSPFHSNNLTKNYVPKDDLKKLLE